MLGKGFDILYIVFVLALLFGIGTLDVIHWPVWSKAWVPEYMHRIEQFNIQKFNDPLSASLSVPNGWQSAMYLCEQLHLPFLLYFLFGKSNGSLPLFFTTRDFSHCLEFATNGRWDQKGIGRNCCWNTNCCLCHMLFVRDCGV